MRAFSLLTLLLPFVAAKLHKKCNCMSWDKGGSWVHNEVLSHYVCYEVYPSVAHWDDNAKVCVGNGGFDGEWIDGETWENDCKQSGIQDGYYPFGTDGMPDESQKLIHVDAVSGSC
ncbi:uncharacterized protein CPUR_03206 [Claviceps purpurea 20.1]|uniref:Cyanovirin-N domain-containing protein n=1 Tax=Claviceps purpurea (strain 20.1) TaxID=1111077 RepID=M1W8Y1_CLAP2|nr:hypothetical protein E4U12_003926 [Claviceps purpurea]CCE29513.1 uncharacterized protein CPUR_03206 [Claviceps purpurea 20.1]